LFIFFLFAKPLTTETCGKAENAAPTGLKNTTTCFSANYSPRSHNNDTPSSEHNPISAPPPRPQEPTRLIVSTLPSYRALVVSIKKGQERNEKENTGGRRQMRRTGTRRRKWSSRHVGRHVMLSLSSLSPLRLPTAVPL